MNTEYEIIKVIGLGVYECPNEEFHTGLIFSDKILAEQEADRLWKTSTTEQDRNSGWCALHYIVKSFNRYIPD